jgi:serine/threonine protein kinase
MTDEEMDIELRLSYYREIAVLDKDHGVYLVQHTDSSKTYVKKIRSLYNLDVYKQLYEHPVVGVPKIQEFIKQGDNLIVFEEYISGTDLETYIKSNGVFSVSETIKISSMLCDILSRLHTMEPPIIHRDIKPSNIMLTEDKRVILLDLNSAKPVTPGQLQDTTLLGTHGFAAPEQYGFGASNIQTDLYAVGILIRYMLSGKLNSSSGSTDELNNVVNKCTQLDPEKRYTSAEELKAAIQKCTKKSLKINRAFIITTCAIASVAIFITIFVWVKNGKSEPEQAQKNNEPEPYLTTALLPSQQDNNTNIESITPNPTNEPIATSEAITGTEATPFESIPTEALEPTLVDDGLNLMSPIGTYEGNDHEKLVIAENGLAYYYCYDVEYTEVECPWTLADNKITITLSLMHCDITAQVKEDYSELIFKTNSLNWNTEVFTKISSDANSYILDPPPKPNKNVTLLSTGEKVYNHEGIRFTIPKQFRAAGDDDVYSMILGINSRDNSVTHSDAPMISLVDVDVGENDPSEAFVASITSYSVYEKYDDIKNDPKSSALTHMSHFFDNVQVTYTEEIQIAGRESILVNVSGMLNSGFADLFNDIYTGYIIFIPTSSSDRVLILQMSQRVGTKNSDEDSFRFIIENAKPAD